MYIFDFRLESYVLDLFKSQLTSCKFLIIKFKSIKFMAQCLLKTDFDFWTLAFMVVSLNLC